LSVKIHILDTLDNGSVWSAASIASQLVELDTIASVDVNVTIVNEVGAQGYSYSISFTPEESSSAAARTNFGKVPAFQISSSSFVDAHVTADVNSGATEGLPFGA
jgi:hypothetical protein